MARYCQDSGYPTYAVRWAPFPITQLNILPKRKYGDGRKNHPNYIVWLLKTGRLIKSRPSKRVNGATGSSWNSRLIPLLRCEDLFGRGQFWPNVDWYNTRAYALGLGDIYINLQGREVYGIVRPGRQYEKLRDNMKQKLEAWIDDENGQKPVRRVYKREEAYKDFDPNLVPDLILVWLKYLN